MKKTGESMRQRIINESINLFLRKGFQGTTMEEVTNAVNLTKGAIYWHFKSKDHLVETILEEWEKAYLDGLIASVNAVEGASWTGSGTTIDMRGGLQAAILNCAWCGQALRQRSGERA